MLLAIDIGNTNISLGAYAGETLGPHWRLASHHDKTQDEYGALVLGLLRSAKISPADIKAIAMASVVPSLMGTFVEVCRHFLRCDPLVVDAKCKTGLNIRYDEPGQVGADRIVDAAAGYKMYGGPVCIIDFGTATTFDAVSADGDFLGGAIAPGIAVAAQALFDRTAKLPKVDLRWPPSPIGRNTTQSLQSGIMFGYVGLVEGIIARIKSELGPETKVIATGGLAEIIAKETNVITILAPWLTLDGLRIIHELNAGLAGVISHKPSA
ncbi:MAG: type III pantothenate kinase [Acidobacteria bacterium]|nr:type III pantothenate kinase [Acidobacteriota bacterium]